MPVPEEIRAVKRPKNTVVEMKVNSRGDVRYIVRERNGSVYSDGRSRPKNGAIVGFIIDGEYVERPVPGPLEPEEIRMTSWAVERLVLNATKDVIEDLRKVYGEEDAETLYCIAILRVRSPELRNSRIKRDYDESILSSIFPNLPMSKNSICTFLQELGAAGLRMRSLMRCRIQRISSDALVAVDTTLLTDNSSINNVSAASRKTRVRGNRDIGLMYAFDISAKEPVCFAVYPGNLLDSKGYHDFIEENDIRNVLLMGDKAFTIKAAGDVDGRELHFLCPIRKNSKAIEKFNLHGYNGALKTYPGVTYCVVHDVQKGLYYYSFRDAERAAEEELAYLQSKKKSGKGLTEEDLRVNREEWGTIVYQSDLDMTPEMAYDTYRQRWLLEMMFDLYKNIEGFDDTRVQSDSSVNGEHMVNFVSTIIASRLMNLFLKKGLLEKMTFGEVIDTLKRSLKFKNEKGEYVFRAQTDKEKDVLRALDLMPKLPPKRRPGRPRKNPQ